MQLRISSEDQVLQELGFQEGPVYIGRQQGCQVLLPDLSVSRQHAVIYTNKKDQWILEDLGSSNKTYLNNTAIHKHPLSHGDAVRISKFRIEVILEKNRQVLEQTVELSDTTMARTLNDDQPEAAHKIIRHLTRRDPPFELPIRRVKHFMSAVAHIEKNKDVFHLHRETTELMLSQLNAFHVWAGFRTEGGGDFQIEGGKMISGPKLNRQDLERDDVLSEVIANHDYILVPQHWRIHKNSRVRSVMAVPIICAGQCYGAMYADNSLEHESYAQSDLDYLILFGIYLAGKLMLL